MPITGRKKDGTQSAYVPNDRDRKIVSACAAACFSLPIIADMIGVCSKTLQRHYREELDTSKGKFLLNVSADLYHMAHERKGMPSVTAAIWLEKTRGGMRETSVVAHEGADGGALPSRGPVVVLLPDNGRGLQLPPPKGRRPKMIEIEANKESDDDDN